MVGHGLAETGISLTLNILGQDGQFIIYGATFRTVTTTVTTSGLYMLSLKRSSSQLLPNLLSLSDLIIMDMTADSENVTQRNKMPGEYRRRLPC